MVGQAVSEYAVGSFELKPVASPAQQDSGAPIFPPSGCMSVELSAPNALERIHDLAALLFVPISPEGFFPGQTLSPKPNPLSI